MHNELLHGRRLVLLCLIASFAAVSAVLFTPSFVDMRQYFDLSEGTVITALTTFIFGFAVGTLYHVVLANRFGRKSALLSGLSFSMIAGFLILFVDIGERFDLVAFFRFLQGAGASCGFVLALSMIADTREKDATRAGSILIYGFSLAVALATFLGGVLTVHWGWQGCFVFLVIYNLFLFLLAFLLPETLLPHRETLVGKTFQGYKKQFADSFLVLHGCMAGFSLVVVYLFPALAPFIAMEEIQLSPDIYGLFALIPYMGMALGFFFWMRYKKQPPRISMLVGIFYTLLGSFVMQIFFANDMINSWTLFLLSAVILAGPAQIYLSSLSVALSEATDRRSAFVVFQFIALMITAISILIISLAPQDPFLYPRASATAAVAALLFWFFLRAHHAHLHKKPSAVKKKKKKRVQKKPSRPETPPTSELIAE